MQLSFGKGLLAGVAGAAVVLAITAAANGVGSDFLLGKTNTVNATSTLTGNAQGPMLKVINTLRLLRTPVPLPHQERKP